ncbi:CDP-diacylglycerol--glycerol-3-phosphate 3-phosphatidyltransferase [Alkaliphilus peptidifermentans]|uniref:CDP-diacylglycerol--glycerol-3-phosphate 3-phosphatidyltransferase n=1 Tax=Alkaliphilus peptidifermentans DSM 18978 TaxID=1120976 RepID=A0A1G5I104_9FIRM|nr:CDP-diacylglycerol--glycerol-3-phosphate 3-phosphatidyltransferase [Alkaliphilus peptidifermentans]SCY69594.1 CDP-diacylglycerol--glycerol-3-phosphate 3-phosphatidyltransferase [Alkaliphilus peptidifermentans DSM 18978]
MNLPNTITIIRFGLIPIFIIMFFSTSSNAIVYSILIFILAGVTDMLDGYIARKYNLVTKWGQAMDPLADKLMQLTVLICFTIKRFLPIWVIVIVGIKELLMVSGGLFLYTQKGKIVIAANQYGKMATVLFYVAIISVAFRLPYYIYLVWISVSFTAYAFLQYAKIGLKEVKMKEIQKTP